MMQKAETTCKIRDCGAMAIVRTNTVQRAAEIAQGCLQGGITVLEISYNSEGASEIISSLKTKFGASITIGAGTVLDSETAKMAVQAGAEFIIAPNLSKDVARLCNRYQIPYAPGCSTISEMIEALELGAAYIKAFPISDFYGPKMVQVLKTPLPQLPVLASGGITLENMHTYLQYGCECLGFGGLLTKGSCEEIEANARKIREIIDQVRRNS